MNSIVLLLTFIVHAHAAEEKAETSTEQSHATTEQVSAEDEEAMNQLIDILVDDEKNDELVDMIADKLVNKLIGVVMMPQPAAVMEPVAMVRPAPSFRASQPVAPALTPVGYSPPQITSNTKYDNSKNVRIDPNREGVIATRNKNYNSVKPSSSERWGVGVTSNGRSANPYAVSYPDAPERPIGKELNKVDMTQRYKPGPEYQNFGSAEYEKLQGKDGFGAARKMDKAGEMIGLGKAPEMDETDGPDAVSVIVTFLLSAFVGSAVTFAAVRLRRGAKVGMRAPLLM